MLGQFDRAFQVELLLNLLAVVLDGLDAQMQLAGNLLGLLPLPDELKHLQLPITEPLEGRLLDVLLPADLMLEHLRGERVAHIDVAAEDPANRRHDFIQGIPFHQIAERARPKGNLGVNHLIVGAHDQHRQPGILGFDVAHQLQPAAVFE